MSQFLRLDTPLYNGNVKHHFMDPYSRIVRYPLEELRNLQSIDEDFDESSADKIQATIDVGQFKPEELSVKLVGSNVVSIEGKHGEKQDEHGFISRHFVRRYVLPENVDIKQIRSKLSSDGVLTITAPKFGEENTPEYRVIPIKQTGQILKAEQKTNLIK